MKFAATFDIEVSPEEVDEIRAKGEFEVSAVLGSFSYVGPGRLVRAAVEAE